jgi:class 3 adenylate cyclase
MACAAAMISIARELPGAWQLRAGVDVGPVVAGVVGDEKFGFDIWGDTVNVAARLSQVADTTAVYLTEAARRRVLDVTADSLGRIHVKGKNELVVFRWTPSASRASDE